MSYSSGRGQHCRRSLAGLGQVSAVKPRDKRKRSRASRNQEARRWGIIVDAQPLREVYGSAASRRRRLEGEEACRGRREGWREKVREGGREKVREGGKRCTFT